MVPLQSCRIKMSDVGDGNLEGDLPVELQTELLMRLPVKSLLRFRCVSKSWRSIIDDPGFISMHLTSTLKNGSEKRLLLSSAHSDRPGHKVGVFSWTTNNTLMKVYELCRSLDSYLIACFGCLDGMVLTANFRGPFMEFVLWNLSIRRSFKLPELPLSNVRMVIGGYLGYDDLSNDYKVLLILKVPVLLHPPSYGYHVLRPVLAVYALKTGIWKITYDLGNFEDVVNRWNYGHRATTRGFVHWVDCYTKPHKVTSVSNNHIVSFSFATETFCCTELPFNDGTDCGRIAIPFCLGGSLAVFSISSKGTSIWLMQKCCDSGLWSLRYSENSCSSIYKSFEEKKRYFHSFLCLDDSNWNFVFIQGTSIKSYNLKSNEINDVAEYGFCCYLDHHAESLLLHNGSGIQASPVLASASFASDN